MGSIPLGANNFFSTEKCVCHLCGTIKIFYFVLLHLLKDIWLLGIKHTTIIKSVSAKTVAL